MIKDNLVCLRKINGYSQEEIAEKIGIPPCFHAHSPFGGLILPAGRYTMKLSERRRVIIWIRELQVIFWQGSAKKKI